MFDRDIHALCQALLSPLSGAVDPHSFVLNQGNSHCSPHREARLMQPHGGERICSQKHHHV